MKKTISLFAILTAAITLNSCWIAPVYQDYETVGKACYFKDYETMRAVTVAKINKSFTDWHWSTKEFDEKLNYYYDNIIPNTEDLEYLNNNGYEWAVRNDSSNGSVALKDTSKDDSEDTENTTKIKKYINSEYFWITNKNNSGVAFYKYEMSKKGE